jgi:hypothetical protein
MTESLCVCGRERRSYCPRCGKFVRVAADGRFVAHELAECAGSHMEYKSCSMSGKPATSGRERAAVSEWSRAIDIHIARAKVPE